ncbi:MAG: PEGA domain-containing protein [Ignavibacteria bacterium]|nr:PEGA domain-containing protein [Ignavibacteria bacterium]
MKLFFLIFFIFSILFISCKDEQPNTPIETAKQGNYYIQSDPDSAEIWVNEVYSGKVTPDVISASEGLNKIKLTRTDYHDTTFAVIFEDEKYIIHPILNLKKNYRTGSIFFSSDPSGAQIWVDGINSYKITPDSVVRENGTKTILLKKNNYHDASFTVDFEEGQTKIHPLIVMTETSMIRPTDFGGATPTNVLAVVRTSTSYGGVTIDVGTAVATFGSPPQDKGVVKVNSKGTDYTLTKQSNNAYIFTPDALSPQGIGFNSGSSEVTFSAANYSLTNNKVFVPGKVTLTAPVMDASIPRASNLTISWAVSGAGSNNAVVVIDKNGKSIFKQNLGTVTSASITSSELQTLSVGTAIVYAISYNYILSNSNEAVLIGETVAFNTVNLQ